MTEDVSADPTQTALPTADADPGGMASIDWVSVTRHPWPDMGPVPSLLHRYWLDISPSPGLLPGRRHFDPAALPQEMRQVLPHIWLMDVEENPRRYRLRLIGGALKLAGSPGQPGDYLDAVDTTGAIASLYDRICASRMPAYRRGPPVLPHDEAVAELESLILPLAADGERVDMLMNCTVYYWRDGVQPGWRLFA